MRPVDAMTDAAQARARGARRILETVRPLRGTRVLDVGAGDGTILEAFPDALLRIGIDIDPVSTARGRARFGGDSRVLFVLADGAALPFSKDTFDAIMLYDVLEHVPDVEGVVREVSRALRPRGVVLVTAANRWSPITMVDDPHAHLPVLAVLPPRVSEAVVHGLLRRPRKVPGIYPRLPSWATLRNAFLRSGIELRLISNLRKIDDPLEVLSPWRRALAVMLRRLGMARLLRARGGRELLGFYDRYAARSWTFVGVK